MSSRLKPGPYREITLPAVLFGIVVGVLLTACFTYAGLLLGFTIGGSTIAAILGFGFLRGVLGRGTIVENNINQTVASGINGVTPGLIFTVPAFYLMGVEFNPVVIAFGAMAGALLGILFIIPIRKQMIELDRLRFPTGTAVATVLKSPGAGVVKARLLLVGLVISALFTVPHQFAWTDFWAPSAAQDVSGRLLFRVDAAGLSELDESSIPPGLHAAFVAHEISPAADASISVDEKGKKWTFTTGSRSYHIRAADTAEELRIYSSRRTMLPDSVNLGRLIGLPPYIQNVWALSLFSLAAGFITGRPGLVVLAGGVLAYWLVTPVAVANGWIEPEMLAAYARAEGAERFGAGGEISEWAHGYLNRPIGIGMLVGGAFTGILVAMPSMMAAFSSLRRVDLRGAEPEELPVKLLYVGVAASFVVLFAATYFTIGDVSVVRALLVAAGGTVWLALAGVVVAQATGMTDWSPISGLALLAIVLGLIMTRHSVPAAILIGAAVCVAISECADMMQDLKTGHLVGATPMRQQVVELCFVALGPAVCLSVIAILWQDPGFGPGKELTAPQAQAVQATVKAVEEGEVPWAKYTGGAVIGSLLGLTGIAGLGVLVGLSMYLPLAYILPYGLGCLVQMAAAKTVGHRWVEERGVPLAAGLLVGEPLVVLAKSILVILRVVPSGVA